MSHYTKKHVDDTDTENDEETFEEIREEPKSGDDDLVVK